MLALILEGRILFVYSFICFIFEKGFNLYHFQMKLNFTVGLESFYNSTETLIM